jgi:hypothetical protein
MFPLVLAQVQEVVHTRFVHNNNGFAVGWFTLALINAGLAQNKGHRGLLWWAVSLFLGPIATFLIVAVLERKPFPEPTSSPYYEPTPYAPYRDDRSKPGPLDF